MTFKKGDRVRKYKGDYQTVGIVRAIFTVTDEPGSPVRVAVAVPQRCRWWLPWKITGHMILIFSPEQMELI